jgi:putative MATE family efflux protein
MNERIQSLMADPRRGLLVLSLPVIISMFFQSLLNFTDFFFVGGLGSDALAAVQLSFPLFFIIIAFASGISVGGTALIAKRLGEKNKKWAEETVMHMLLLAILFAAVITILGVLFADDATAMLGGNAIATQMASDYLLVIFAGSVIFFLTSCFMAILQAEGDTKTPMKFAILFVLLNIVLDPIFIYSFDMGVMGAAFATVLAELLAAIAFVFFVVMKKKNFLEFKLRDFIFTPQIMKNILKVGFPSAIAQIALSIAVIGVNLILSGFGDLAISAYGIGFRIDSFAIMPVLGLASGVIPMVGYYRGAKDFRSAKKINRIALKLAVAFMVIVGTVIFALSSIIPYAFTNDPEIVAMAVDYFRIIAFAYPFMGIAIVTSYTFQGLGRGMPSLTITMTRAALLLIPISYYLAYMTSFGVLGVWIGTAIAATITAAISIVWIEASFKKLCRSCD